MKRPMIKFSHRPIRIGVDQVRIGGAVQGLAFDVSDPDGWLWALVGLLDGTRTFDQVAADLRWSFPDRPVDHVALAVDALYLTGHLEDADEPEPIELSATERERYSRSRELFQWMDCDPRSSGWETQMTLKRAKVVVLGLGGVGGAAALALTVSGVGQVHCVDRDVVTLSNLNRQVLFTERDLGRPKAQAAVQRLRERNSDVRVTGERRDLADPDAVAAVIGGFHVVVLAADNPPEIRSWTNHACCEAQTPWVLGGYDGPLASGGLYRPGTGPCYDCARTAERERLAGLPVRTEWPPAAGIAPPHAANVNTVTITGSFVANAVISLLTGVPALQVNRLYEFNLVKLLGWLESGPETPHPGCPTC